MQSSLGEGERVRRDEHDGPGRIISDINVHCGFQSIHNLAMCSLSFLPFGAVRKSSFLHLQAASTQYQMTLFCAHASNLHVL